MHRQQFFNRHQPKVLFEPNSVFLDNGIFGKSYFFFSFWLKNSLREKSIPLKYELLPRFQSELHFFQMLKKCKKSLSSEAGVC